MNNLFNMLSGIFSQNFNNQQTNTDYNATINSQETQANKIQSDTIPPNQNVLNDYPEEFFTSQKYYTQNISQVTSQQNPSAHQNFYTQSINNQMQNNQPLFFNSNLMDVFKNFLPLLLNKNGKQDLSGLLKNINPQFSNIFSMLSNKSKKEEAPSTSSKTKIIDLSEYSKTN